MVVLNVLNYYLDSIQDHDDLLPFASCLGMSHYEELLSDTAQAMRRTISWGLSSRNTAA